MYTKTTKRYRKKLKRTGINGKTPHVHGLDDNTVRMPTLQDFFFLVDIKIYILKFRWTHKGPRTAKKIFQKNNTGGFTLPNFKTYYQVTLIKTPWNWYENDMQRDGTELSPKNKSMYL